MSNDQLLVLKSAHEVQQLTEYIKGFDYVAFDTETTGLHQGAEIIGFSVSAEENKAYYVILAYWDSTQGKLVYFNDVKEESRVLIDLLRSKSLIMHNAIFDCRVVQDYFKVSLIEALHTDTMVLAHLLNENRRIGLKELAKEYFGEDAAEEAALMKASVVKNGGTTTKANFEIYKADRDLLAYYGAKDALLTFKLFNELVIELYDQKLDKFFYEEEAMPLLKTATYQLNTVGLRVDVPGLQSLKKQLEAECLEAKDFIYSEIAPYIKDKYPGKNKSTTFNIGASSQLAWLCFGVLNLEFGSLTKVGKSICKDLLRGKLPYTPSAKRQFIQTCIDSKGAICSPAGVVNGKKVSAKKIRDPWAYIECNKKILEVHAPRYKWIAKLLEYQAKMKIKTTYVEGIEERLEYGMIYPSFLQTGTTSGRYSSRNPNFQNMPRKDKRVKKLIIPRDGNVFVGADYSQLEPRIFSYVSNDESLLQAFKSGEDFYSTIGIRVYGKYDATPQKEGSDDAFGVKYPELRDLSKVIALATVYGSTANNLSQTTKKNVDDTQDDMDEYLNQFPGVRKLMKESHELAKSQGYVENIFGRKRRMPEALKIKRIYGNVQHKDLPYEARKLLNLSTNHRIQSSAASIVNRAMIRFYRNVREAGINCQIVTQVHDSLIIECKKEDAENVSVLLQDAMETTTILSTISLEAVPRIGQDFSQV